MLTFCPFRDLSSIAPLERFVCSPFSALQNVGGGLDIVGTATLINTNVYSNQAAVRACLLPLPGPLLQRPAGTLRVLAFCIQNGGGLYISGTATLINTAIYQNVASVCSAIEPV